MGVGAKVPQNNSKLQRLPKRSYFIPISYQVALLGPFCADWMFRLLRDGIGVEGFAAPKPL